MTLEERVMALEAEIKAMNRPRSEVFSCYSEASKKCKEIFEGVRLDGQNYAASQICQHLAREAFKAKHRIEPGKETSVPKRYIQTEEDASEYVRVFEAFLKLHQEYMKGEGQWSS